MRKVIYMLSVLCVAALWGGCQRGGGAEEGTAEVTLRFATRADGTDGTDPNALPNEGIKTLRVILYKAGEDGVYSFYDSFYRTVDASEDGIVLETSMRIYDVPLGNYRFYVIGNEESVGKKYDTESAVEANLVPVGDERKLLIKDDGSETGGESRFYFPQKAADIVDYGLPMARMLEVEVAKDMSPVSVTLERAVAKLNVIVENATANEMTVRQIEFGAFAADQEYLFRREQLDVPDGTTYAGMLFGDPDKGGYLNTTIPPFEEGTFVFYVYPSSANIGGGSGTTAYTMGMTTAAATYPKDAFVTSTGKSLIQMTRNRQYNIRAVVSADAQITINWESTDWTGVTINVPDFK